MDDLAILAQINELVDEEHKLEQGKAGVGLSDDDAQVRDPATVEHYQQ